MGAAWCGFSQDISVDSTTIKKMSLGRFPSFFLKTSVFFGGWRVPGQFSGLRSFGFAVPRLVLLLVKLRFGLDDENFTILKRWKSERGEVGKNLGI